MIEDARERILHERPRTLRHPSAGLLTRATTNFNYGRVSAGGKIHWIEYALIGWEVPPFPQICYVYRCGPQSIVVFPIAAECVVMTQLCARCFSYRE